MKVVDDFMPTVHTHSMSDEQESLEDVLTGDGEPFSDAWWEQAGGLYGVKGRALEFVKQKFRAPGATNYEIARRAGYTGSDSTLANSASRIWCKKQVQALYSHAQGAKSEDTFNVAKPDELLGVLSQIARSGRSNAERTRAAEILLKYTETFAAEARSEDPLAEIRSKLEKWQEQRERQRRAHDAEAESCKRWQ